MRCTGPESGKDLGNRAKVSTADGTGQEMSWRGGQVLRLRGLGSCSGWGRTGAVADRARGRKLWEAERGDRKWRCAGSLQRERLALLMKEELEMRRKIPSECRKGKSTKHLQEAKENTTPALKILIMIIHR